MHKKSSNHQADFEISNSLFCLTNDYLRALNLYRRAALNVLKGMIILSTWYYFSSEDMVAPVWAEALKIIVWHEYFSTSFALLLSPFLHSLLPLIRMSSRLVKCLTIARANVVVNRLRISAILPGIRTRLEWGFSVTYLTLWHNARVRESRI